MRKKDNTDYYINRHSCFLLQYHIVFVTKYRHPVLTGKVKDVVYERIHYASRSKRVSHPRDQWRIGSCPYPDGS